MQYYLHFLNKNRGDNGYQSCATGCVGSKHTPRFSSILRHSFKILHK